MRELLPGARRIRQTTVLMAWPKLRRNALQIVRLLFRDLAPPPVHRRQLRSVCMYVFPSETHPICGKLLKG